MSRDTGLVVEGKRCLRCNHEWIPRSLRRPAQCPSCSTSRWDEPKDEKEPGPKRKGGKALSVALGFLLGLGIGIVGTASTFTTTIRNSLDLGERIVEQSKRNRALGVKCEDTLRTLWARIDEGRKVHKRKENRDAD